MTAILDNDDKLIGIFTDGDLRRSLDERIDIHKSLIDEVMTRHFVKIHSEQRAAIAVELMEDKKITSLLVTDEKDFLVGALNIHDLFKAGVM